jgi:hypothetical protein
MVAFTKPSNVNNVWAAGGDKIYPGDTKYSQGWLVEIPPRQYFNQIDGKQDQYIAHANQHGIPLWDSVTEYQYAVSGAKSIVMGSNGTIYRTLTTNTNQNPTTTVGTHWEIAFANAGDFYTKTQSDANYLAKASNLSDLTNAATARTNLSVYAIADVHNKTEVDAKTTVASTAQAQALASNTTIITPLRLADAFGGSNQSFAANGYQKLPGGLIIQWGTSASGTGSGTLVSLPITFPNNIFSVVVADIAFDSATGLHTTAVGTQNFTTSTFRIVASAASSAYWIAIGN